MTENNQFRDYSGSGSDFTWTAPPVSGPNGASPFGEKAEPPTLPGGPNGTRPYERGFDGEPSGSEEKTGGDETLRDGPGSAPRNVPGGDGAEDGPGRAGSENGSGAAPPGDGPGGYYSERLANDPTAPYETVRDQYDPVAEGGEGAADRSGGREDEPSRSRRPAGLYGTLSNAAAGWRERLRFARRPAPGPAEVRPAAPMDTEFTTVTGYRVPLASRPFLWCAGADPDLIPNRSELYRYSTIGVFVCLVAFVATAMFAVFASVVGGGFSLAIIPFALIWGVLIFWVDRSIVAEPAYGKVLSGTDESNLLDPVGRSRKPGWLTYLMRMILALGVSFIIAEAVTLLIFQSEVRDQLAFTQTARTRELDAKFKAADEDKRRQLDAKYGKTDLCADSDRKERVRNLAQKKRQDESLGRKGEGLSGEFGAGPITRALEADFQKAQREYTIAQRECDAAHASVVKELKAYQKREEPIRDADRLNVQKNVGWVAQEKALHEFIDGSGSAIVVALPWVLRVTILVLDLLPLSVKLLGGATVYERRLREQAYSQAYETQRLREAHIAKIDMRYDLDRLTTRDSYDRGRANLRDARGRGLRGTRKYRNQYL